MIDSNKSEQNGISKFSIDTLRIEAYRTARGMSVEELALASGISVEVIRDYESGIRFPSNADLYKLCEVFDTTYEQLTGMIPTGYATLDQPWKKYYTSEAFRSELPDCSLFEMVLRSNQNNKEAIAIEYFKTRITYGYLFEQVEKTRCAFVKLGVKKGDVVTISLPNIPEAVYCIYALSCIGATANMVDLRLEGERLVHHINTVHSDIVVCSDVFAGSMADIQDQVNVKHFIVLTPYDSIGGPVGGVLKLKNKNPDVKRIRNRMGFAEFLKQGKGVPAYTGNSDVGSDDVICIFHTSGTTALPKAVMMTNGNMNSLGHCYKYVPFDIQDGDRFLSNIPPFLAYNVIFTVHMPLVNRMTVIMLPTCPIKQFADELMRVKPNHVGGSAAGWREFYKNPKVYEADFSFLKAACSGNDTLTLEHKQRINEILAKGGCKYGVSEGYGMTECGSVVTSNWPAMTQENSIGVPLWINIVAIFDPEDCNKELPYGEKGEICIYGPSVMKGYYGDPETTADVLKMHSDGRIWFHSKDLGHMDQDGAVYFDGRIKRVIIEYAGRKLSPLEYENLIMRHSNVEACCVVGKPNPEFPEGNVPAAYIVLKNKEQAAQEATLEELKAVIDKNYEPYAQVRYYNVLDELPMTPNEKIDYRKLSNME